MIEEFMLVANEAAASFGLARELPFLYRIHEDPSAEKLEALAELLNISDTQLSYVENADPGCGLMKFGGAFIPFVNSFPEDTELYKLMTTKPADREQVKPNGV